MGWGYNNEGSIGDGTYDDSNVPVQAGTDNDWVDVSAGYYHSLAVKADGTIWGWGEDDGSYAIGGSDSPVPVQIGTDNDWAKVAASYYRSFGIKTDGTLWAWGYNSGYLGDGTFDDAVTPVQIGSATDWVSISSFSYGDHVLAIRANGTLWAWGANGEGQLGIGNTADESAPVQVGTDTDWALASAGPYHSMAIKTNGSLYGWGYGGYGELGMGNNDNSYVPLLVSSGWSNVAAGYYYTLGTKTDGTLWGWGYNPYGNIGNGTYDDSNVPVQSGIATNWTAVTASYDETFSFGIQSNGSLWSWGYNGYGYLGDGTYDDSTVPVLVGEIVMEATSTQSVSVLLAPSGISVSNASAPDCNSTTCTEDDTFTADVTVTFTEKPASGTLALTGDGIVGTVPAVDVTTIGATSYTFTGVKMAAEGAGIELTATFSAGCGFFDDELGIAPSCNNLPFAGPSCSVSDIDLANTDDCDDNGTVADNDDFFTTDVTVTFTFAPSGGTLTLKRGSTVVATTTNDLTCTTTYTFEDVELASDGAAVVLTAEFSMGCTYTSGTLMTAPEPCSCQPTTAFTQCPGGPAVNTAPGTCGAAATYTATANGDPAPSYTYAFSGATSGSGSGTGSGSTFNRGVTAVTVTATNDCGSATCTFNVTVTDNIPPSATCKPYTAYLGANGTVGITPSDVFQSGTDNCGTVNPATVSPNSFTCANIGTPVQVTLTVNDGNGNTNTCTATVTVADNTPPSITCKPYTAQLGAGGTVSLNPGNVFLSGTDNCGDVNLVSVTPSTFACGNIGPNTVTLTANDGNGNTATCQATVTVADSAAPLASCKNATVNLSAGGSATITAATVNNSSSDNCGVQSVSALPLSFDCTDLGPNTVVLTVTDVNGNSSTCNATVTVKDVTPPPPTCQGQTVALGANGQYALSAAALFTGGTDNCGTVNVQSVTPAILYCNNVGPNTVTLKVNDGNGNVGTCTATVTVSPFIVVNSVTTTPASCTGGDGTITVDATAPSAPGIQFGYSIDNGIWWNLTGTFTNLAPGTYPLTVRAYGAPGCDLYYGTVTVGSSGGSQQLWYKDLDGDGYTDGVTETSCTAPAGYTATALPGDCDDSDPLEYPGQLWYRDSDNDGHSDGTTVVACSKPSGHKHASQLATTNGDCNDSVASIHPGATETCNNIDDDCDGSVDEGLGDLTYVGNVTFTSQSQVNAWSMCYTVIQGNLTVQNSGVVNLNTLVNLRKVTGNVTIKQSGLANMAGLVQLDTVGGSLTINNNTFGTTKLQTLDGLEDLDWVGGQLKVFYNTQLTDCCAIHDLVGAEPNGTGGTVSVYGNETGCDSVSEIEADCDGSNSVPGNNGVTAAQLGLYPNPATGQVTVSLPGGWERGELRVSDLLGRTVTVQLLEPGTAQARLDAGSWGAGVYLVTAVLDGRPSTLKLVVE